MLNRESFIFIVYSILFLLSILVSFMKGVSKGFPNLSYFYIFLIFCFYIFFILEFKKCRKRNFCVILWLLIFCTYSVLTSFWSLLPSRSFLYSINQFVIISVVFIFPFLIFDNEVVCFEKISVKFFLEFILIFLLLYIFINFVYFYFFLEKSFSVRFGGVYENANSMGNIIFISFVIGFVHYGVFKKWKFLLYVFFSFLLITQSKNFLLAALFFIVLYLFLKKNYKKIAVSMFCILPLMIFSVSGRSVDSTFGMTDGVLDRDKNSRPLIWLTAFEYSYINNKILFGTGFDTGYEVTSNTVIGDLISKRNGTDHAGSSLHSGIVKIIITHGFLGFLLYSILVWKLFKYFKCSTNLNVKNVGIPYLIAPIISDLFNVNYWGAIGSVSTIFYFSVLVILMLLAYQDGPVNQGSKKKSFGSL
jgi:hypothetical protein